MLKRFSFTASGEKMRRQFGSIIPHQVELEQRYQIAPGQYAYALCQADRGIEALRWGFVPHWARHAQDGEQLSHVFAETLPTAFSFRLAIRQTRCLVFADSYYAWQGQGRNARPHRLFFPDQSIMTLAALYDRWTSPQGQVLSSFALVHLKAPPPLKSFGDSLPALLQNNEERQLWLNPQTPLAQVLNLLQHCPEPKLQYYPTNPAIEDPHYQDPELHRPFFPPNP